MPIRPFTDLMAARRARNASRSAFPRVILQRSRVMGTRNIPRISVRLDVSDLEVYI
jgi:hypothetical protein